MSWQNEMVLILRHLIDDVDAVTYTQSRLEQSLLIGAQLIRTEIDFQQTYSIDVDEEVISPDPTRNTRDDAFVNLVTLKTACIILKSEAKLAGSQAVSVSDGPSKVDLTKKYDAAQKQADSACSNYEQAKIEYMTGSGSPGKAVVGPIVNANIDIIQANI